MKQITIDITCEACHGTGLYSGFAEPEGTAVVCLGCKGQGHHSFTYTPFTKRKGKKGIRMVFNSAGGFIATGIGPKGLGVTYKEFQKGMMPG